MPKTLVRLSVTLMSGFLLADDLVVSLIDCVTGGLLTAEYLVEGGLVGSLIGWLMMGGLLMTDGLVESLVG